MPYASSRMFPRSARPLDTDTNGGSVLAYVSLPKVHYVWQYNMACQAKTENVPPDVVLVVYVRLDELSEGEFMHVGGIVTHWQFVVAEAVRSEDGRIETLPKGFAERYDHRLW